MIAVTVPFINKTADCLFSKEFSKNLVLPIVASASRKLNLVTLQLKPSKTIWFGRSDASKYLLNPKCLNHLILDLELPKSSKSPKSRAWSRSIVCQHKTLRTLTQHTANKASQAH